MNLGRLCYLNGDRSRTWNERPRRSGGNGRLSGVNEVSEDVALLELEGRDGRQDPLDRRLLLPADRLQLPTPLDVAQRARAQGLDHHAPQFTPPPARRQPLPAD